MEKIKALLRLLTTTTLGRCLLIAITWQFLFTVIGYLFQLELPSLVSSPSHKPLTSSILDHTMLWDAGWYMQVIQGSYFDSSSASAAFYPLFPAIISFLHTITFGLIGYAKLGILLNTLMLTASIYFLKGISERFVSKKYSWWPVILFLTSPVAIFMHMFYTEALFCALAFGSYYFALKKRWWYMGILLALLTATRLPSILFVGLCALEFMRAYEWNWRKIFNRNLLALLLAPIGFIIYGITLYFARGDFFGMLSAYKLTNDWSYHAFNPNIFEVLGICVEKLYSLFISHSIPVTEYYVVNLILPFFALVILLISSIYLIRIKKNGSHIGLPLALFGIATFIFVTLNSNIVSVHRYMLPCIGIYLATTLILNKLKSGPYVFIGICYASTLLQAYLLILFVNRWFAG